jgi:hypothetical protein
LRNDDKPRSGGFESSAAIYQFFTLRFAFSGIHVKKAGHRNGGDSVIHRIAERLRGAGLAMLAPASLVDRFLDQIDRLGAVLLPIQADGLACQRVRIDRRID